MSKKQRRPRKTARSLLPPGVKRSTRPISAALRKLLNEDRGIASGGSARAGSTRA